MDMTGPCWHCPTAWWLPVVAGGVALTLFAGALFLLPRKSSRIRALGGLVCFPVAFLYYVTTMSVLRYGVNIEGGWDEPPKPVLGVAILAGLYLATAVLFLIHRSSRARSAASAPNQGAV